MYVISKCRYVASIFSKLQFINIIHKINHNIQYTQNKEGNWVGIQEIYNNFAMCEMSVIISFFFLKLNTQHKYK